MTTVERALAAALYAESDADLDTGASLLAADPSADAELALRGRELVGRAWERGWQPADVVRMVRRELAEPHVRLAVELVLVQLKRYERLPARWAEQAEGLADAVRGAGERSEDRFTRATTVLELYRLLLRLPAIEPVGPVPGTPVHLPPVHGEPKTLTRIRALLAKAEATEFPEEAEALSTKAQELMALHSIDEAVLAAGGHRGDAPGACRIGVDAPYETSKAILLDAVASANHCRAVWNGDFGFSTVVGFEADLEAVELLYTSLLVQGTAAMTRAEAAQRAGGRKRTKTFRQSFLLAYANRLGDLLSATARQVESTASTTLLPVLATRAVAVAGRAEEMFPRTVRTRVRGATDEAGWQDGTTAANRAHHGPGRPRLP
ncbi:DUF2786 domain-containing protein [Streptomyces melanogenes]|uniref:DUF2786 domain-containing protein n=1 Tax=Streptomyces melanogenes TaxID=67326 RepID=UPI00167ECBA0|nr:DUF2786 domain-containing protein [Streptomyces melanogenes]GGP74591.1 hypothetical protein GCM10010278_60970 [Streptomyces melanogenes]